MKILSGTSGWSYPHWRGIFYEDGIKAKNWLSFYAMHFKTVEINCTFYVLPRTETIESWFKMTPDDFLFSVKAPGLITHRRRLKNCEDNLRTFFDRIKVLEHKCGPILFQLPMTYKKNMEILTNFIELLQDGFKYAFELRSPTWWDDEVIALLHSKRIAFCIFEIASLSSPRIVSGDFIYIRLHGHEPHYTGKYTDHEVLEWKRWVVNQNKEAYVYFDNTDKDDDALQNSKNFNNIL